MAKRMTEGDNGKPVADRETELNYMRKLDNAQNDIDTYVAIKRNIVKAAQKAGVNTAMIEKSRTAKSLNLPDVIQNEKDYIRYCAMRNMPITQVELFGEKSQEEVNADQRSQDERTWDAGQAGYAAGKAGRPIEDNPHLQGSEEFAEWRSQWNRGQEHLAKVTLSRPGNETVQADDRRQRGGGRGRRGAAAGSLQPNTPEEVRAAVAEDDAEQAGAEEERETVE